MHRFLMLSFSLAAIATPAYIIGRSLRGYMAAGRDRSKVVGRALVALTIWLVLSGAVATIQFVVLFAAAHSDVRGMPLPVGPEFVVINALYLLAMGGLALWVWRAEAAPRRSGAHQGAT